MNRSQMCLSLFYSLPTEVRPSSVADFSPWLLSSEAHVVGHRLFLNKVTLKVKIPKNVKVDNQQSIE